MLSGKVTQPSLEDNAHTTGTVLYDHFFYNYPLEIKNDLFDAETKIHLFKCCQKETMHCWLLGMQTLVFGDFLPLFKPGSYNFQL